MEAGILYEDAQILIVHKPAGLATESAKPFEPDLVSRLKSHVNSGYLGCIHRLDQPVEGLLAFAKTPEAAAALSKQLSDGELGKEYLALVFGTPQPAEGDLTGYLKKEAGGIARVLPEGKKPQGSEWKHAALSYETLEQTSAEDGASRALVRVRLQTGRFHQIRAQFAAAGHPLLGDRKYGSEESRRLSESLRIRNVALCAYRLRVRHPKTGEVLEFETEPGWQLPGAGK